MSTQAAGFVCEVCGRSFTLERGLTRHRNYAHGGGQGAALATAQAPPAQEAPTWDWEQEMAGMVGTLKEEQARLSRHLEMLDAERAELSGKLKRVAGALRALNGESTPGPKKGSKANLAGTGKKKAQASIQGDTVRVTSKDRDELQSIIALLRGKDLGVELTFTNYRTN